MGAHDSTVTVATGDLHALCGALGRIAGDVARARTLARDAIAKLFETFDRVKQHLAVDRESYEEAIRAISGSGGQGGLVSVVRDVINRFVDDIVRLGKASVRILTEIEALRGHAELVASRGSRIESIARTTRVISLNARIEAQRFGDSGAVFRVVADEIKKLAHETDDLSRAIGGAITAQARSLDVTASAASELAATDLELAVASRHQLEDTITRLGSISATSTRALERIQSDVDAAIQALQFEDMLDQLLNAVGDKLGAVEHAIGELAAGRPAGELAAVERDVVTQRDTSTGSVELF
jgi:methyl-accepting chemotaxis protein|nr:methyl-accepting chemotaxis protein [Kofleriaceae bacterium]